MWSLRYILHIGAKNHVWLFTLEKLNWSPQRDSNSNISSVCSLFPGKRPLLKTSISFRMNIFSLTNLPYKLGHKTRVFTFPRQRSTGVCFESIPWSEISFLFHCLIIELPYLCRELFQTNSQLILEKWRRSMLHSQTPCYQTWQILAIARWSKSSMISKDLWPHWCS